MKIKIEAVSEIKAEVKLICSRPGTAIQNRKKKYVHGRELPFKTKERKINLFMAEDCHSK